MYEETTHYTLTELAVSCELGLHEMLVNIKSLYWLNNMFIFLCLLMNNGDFSSIHKKYNYLIWCIDHKSLVEGGIRSISIIITVLQKLWNNISVDPKTAVFGYND